jgi:hypothetical protein
MRYLVLAIVIAGISLMIVHDRGRDDATSSRLASHTVSPARSARAAAVPARVVPGAPAFETPPVVRPDDDAADDDAMPVAPVLDPETFTLAREAALPAVRACADAAGDARVAVTIRVEVAQGRVRIPDARSDTAAVAACVAQAAQAVELVAPVDQPDGVQEVTLFAGG